MLNAPVVVFDVIRNQHLFGIHASEVLLPDVLSGNSCFMSGALSISMLSFGVAATAGMLPAAALDARRKYVRVATAYAIGKHCQLM